MQCDNVLEHRWSHLAKPPYKLVGSFRSVYQAVPGASDCPLQPGSSCDYCGQGIYNVVVFRGSCGTEFKVGADCAQRSGDVKVITAIKKVLQAADKVKRQSKDAVVSERIAELRASDAVRDYLNSQPHPNTQMAARSYTLGDYYAFVFEHCGAAGRARTLKALEALLKTAGVI